MDLTFELHITLCPKTVFFLANLSKRKSIASRGLCPLRRRCYGPASLTQPRHCTDLAAVPVGLPGGKPAGHAQPPSSSRRLGHPHPPRPPSHPRGRQPCSWEGLAPLASVLDTLNVGDPILPGKGGYLEASGRDGC